MRCWPNLLPVVTVALAGCISQGPLASSEATESAARYPFRDRIVPLVEKKAKGDGWTAEVAEKSYTGLLAPNRDELWSEDQFTIDLRASTRAGEPLVIPVDSYTGVLKGIRSGLRDLVEDHGGEQIDWTVTEAFRERRLEFSYKLGGVLGGVVVRMTPRSDAADETLTRVTVHLREQPLPP